MRFPLAVIIVSLGLMTVVAIKAASTAASNRAPNLIELNDQFDKPQTLSFPTTNMTLLTIADKKGAEQIADWIKPVKERFGTNLNIRGIADVSAVPGPLKKMVRKRFQKEHTYPVMLDWSGKICAQFEYQPGLANVFILERDGTIHGRFTGIASGTNLSGAIGLLEKAIRFGGNGTKSGVAEADKNPNP
jgi:hypothetical protein